MKRKHIAKQLLMTGAIALITITGCKKDFFDINEPNPNLPSSVSKKELLPSAEAAIAMAVGNNLQINGGIWAQFWTQTTAASQYKTLEQYNPGPQDYDRPWKALYADALEDLKVIIQKADEDKAPNYKAIAKILQAYSYQILTDNWGDVPFTQAVQVENGILSPAYDPQSVVYDGLINIAKEGIATIDDSSETAVVPGDDDMLLHGDMSLWRKFGNTLLLRAYLRLAYVDPGKAQAGITELNNSGAVYLAEGEEVRIDYLSEGGRTHPLYSSIVALGYVQNLVASKTSYDYLTANNDPRLDVLYVPSASGTGGLLQGAYDLPAGTPVSNPGPITGANGTIVAGPDGPIDYRALSALAPVKLMTGYESFFLQAEARLRTWMPGDPAEAYDAGITESFASFGIVGDTVAFYLSQPQIAYPSGGSFDDQLKAIITEKWVALNGNGGDEAWTEWRRTGYPDFFTVSTNSLYGGSIFPQRFLYPTDEEASNGSFPGQRLIYDKVWWDVN
jgi:hypothetical protein